MFGRGTNTTRMRGRNDGGAAQKRRVFITVCTLVLMVSLITLYHGSFFSNRRSKNVVEANFDPASSEWSASLTEKNTKINDDESPRVREDEVEKASDDVTLEDRHTHVQEASKGEEEESKVDIDAEIKDDTPVETKDVEVEAKEDAPMEVEAKDDSALEKEVSEKEVSAKVDDDGSASLDAEQGQEVATSDEDTPIKSFPVCEAKYTEIIPCLDLALQKKLKLKVNHSNMEHYERHCPPPDHRLHCLIPPPANYRVPIRWPASRDEVWQANVPHTFLATEKSDQHWMVVNGQKVNFPGGGTHFPNGADKYIASIAKMLKSEEGNMTLNGRIRTVLDVGCGVASFGAYLLPLDIIAMSVAPNDVHQNQIQFALERGIPATLGVLGTKRLPYPSKSFDLAHCSRCRIEWHQRGGILLLEVDRLLRPGGYFVWSAPPAYRDDPEDVEIWKAMTSLVSRMCWTVAAHQDQTVIWQKPLTNECYEIREEGTEPPLCKNSDPDSAWMEPMETCITPLTGEGPIVQPWPKRMFAPSPRLKELNISEKKYLIDSRVWKKRLNLYWSTLKGADQLEQYSVRNIMDMKANFGSFAAALREKEFPVWVMNVVPSTGPNTLKVVYDRGFIGSMHNWCEAFSTYPRTYDLLHAWNVFSDIEKAGCSTEDLLLEMDRILRPMGLVIIRDRSTTVDRISKYLDAIRWSNWHLVIEADKDDLSDADEKILFARKELWQPEDVL